MPDCVIFGIDDDTLNFIKDLKKEILRTSNCTIEVSSNNTIRCDIYNQYVSKKTLVSIVVISEDLINDDWVPKVLPGTSVCKKVYPILYKITKKQWFENFNFPGLGILKWMKSDGNNIKELVEQIIDLIEEVNFNK